MSYGIRVYLIVYNFLSVCVLGWKKYLKSYMFLFINYLMILGNLVVDFYVYINLKNVDIINVICVFIVIVNLGFIWVLFERGKILLRINIIYDY